MDVSPCASVIIVGYNSAPYLPDCLHALRRQDTQGFELVLVDNASQDDTVGAALALYPGIRIVRSSENLGFPAACNLGAREASGDLLIFLNPDTVVEPGWLSALLDAVRNSPPDVGAWMSQIVLIDDPQKINTTGNALHYLCLSWCQHYLQERLPAGPAFDVAIGSGASFAVTRSVFEEVGGFDSDFFLYHEDTELSWRIRMMGYRVMCVPSSVVRHAYKFNLNRTKVLYAESNRLSMVLKLYSWRLFVLILPALVASECFLGLYFMSAGVGMAKLRATARVLRRLRAVLRSRRSVQQRRRLSDRDLLPQFSTRIEFPGTPVWLQRLLNPLSAAYWRVVSWLA